MLHGIWILDQDVSWWFVLNSIQGGQCVLAYTVEEGSLGFLFLSQYKQMGESLEAYL